MKHIFEITQNDDTEPHSGRFAVENADLNIVTEYYSLREGIEDFLRLFREEYEYLRSINDDDLNDKALRRKEKFGHYINLYKEVIK